MSNYPFDRYGNEEGIRKLRQQRQVGQGVARTQTRGIGAFQVVGENVSNWPHNPQFAVPEMRLHLTDYHLESARLCLAMGGKHTEAQDHYEKAKKLIKETGYHRRDKELEELRVRLDQVLGTSPA